MLKETKLGIIGMLGLLAFIITYHQLKTRKVFKKSFELRARFSHTDDLKVKTPVSINGFLVGEVIGITWTGDSIYAQLSIFEPVNLPRNTRAVLEQPSMMGGRSVELKYEGSCVGTGDCLPSGSVLSGTNNTLRDIMISSLQEKLLKPMDSLLQGFTDESLRQTLRSTNESIHGFASSAAKLVITLQGQQAWLQTIASVQQQTADLRKQSPELIQQIAGLAQSLQQLQKTDWKANEALASQYLQQVDSLCNTTIQQLDKLNPLIEKQNAWILSWQDPKSSIGQWLHATESVDSLHLQLNDLQKTLEDIRLHPEKYRKLL